jgi:hypothetical protein
VEQEDGIHGSSDVGYPGLRAHLDTLQKHAKRNCMEVTINGVSPKWMVESGKSIKKTI